MERQEARRQIGWESLFIFHYRQRKLEFSNSLLFGVRMGAGTRQCGIRAAETLNSPSGAVTPWVLGQAVRKITISAER